MEEHTNAGSKRNEEINVRTILKENAEVVTGNEQYPGKQSWKPMLRFHGWGEKIFRGF